MSANFTFKVEAGGVPVGNYRATFLGLEEVPENKEKNYSAGVRFRWQIAEGPQAGQIASRVTSRKLTENNVTGKMLAALAGRPLKLGEAISATEFVGRAYLIIVAQGQGGGTRVESTIPV